LLQLTTYKSMIHIYFTGTQFELEDDVTLSCTGYLPYIYHNIKTSQRVETQCAGCCADAYVRSGHGSSTGQISLRLV